MKRKKKRKKKQWNWNLPITTDIHDLLEINCCSLFRWLTAVKKFNQWLEEILLDWGHVSLKATIIFFSGRPTYFLALSLRKLCSSNSFWLPISRRRVVNLFCHSLQWLRSANFSGELSKSTKSILSTVSSFWKLLAISVYLKDIKSIKKCKKKKNLNVAFL